MASASKTERAGPGLGALPAVAMMRIRSGSDAIVGAFALLLGLGLGLYGIEAMVGRPSTETSLYLSPSFWPYVIAASMAGLGVLLLIAAFRAPPARDGAPAAPRPLRLALALVCAAGLFTLIEPLGMPITMAAAQILLMRGLSRTGWVTALLVSLALSAGLTAFFITVASVPVPLGPLTFLVR